MFKSKVFLLTLLSIIFNGTATSVYLLGESWYVVLGNSLGIVLMMTAIPRFLLMPFGGVLADRFKRTHIMFLSDAIRSVLLVVMMACFLLKLLSFSWLLVFALLFGILDAFYWPASTSLIPTIVSEQNLAQANSIVQITQQVFFLAGPLIGGLILTFGSYSILFGCISIILIFGGFISLLIGKWIPKRSNEDVDKQLSLIDEWKEGFIFIKTDSFIKILLITLVLAGFFLTGPLSIAIPLLVDSVLKGSALTLSYLEISVSIGMILGGTIIAVTKIRKRRTLLSVISLSICGICITLLGIAKHFFAFLFLLTISGLIITFSNTFFITLLQKKTPIDKIGRVMSIVTAKKDKLKRRYQLYNEIIAHIHSLSICLKKAEQDRVKLEESKKDWLAGISHDLKTPLTYITGYSALLLNEDYSWSEKEKKSFLQEIEKKGKHIESLIQDLNFSFQMNNIHSSIPLKKSNGNIVEFIKNLVADIANDPRAFEYNLSLHSDEDFIQLHFDEKLLYRALQNLLMNAILHNPPGTSIHVTTLRENDQFVKIMISDDGLGMDQETVDNLFKKYYRRTTTNSTEFGTGLGLSIVKNLILAHGGHISINSEVSKGTTFYVTLPINPSFTS